MLREKDAFDCSGTWCLWSYRIWDGALLTVAVGALVALIAACGGDGASSDAADGGPTAVAAQPTATASPSSTLAASGNPGVEASPGPGDDALYVPEDSIDEVDKRIYVTIDNERVYIKNGGTIILGGGRAVEIYLDPYPPSTLRTYVDLYVTEDGEPLDDIGAGVDFDMLAMEHGPFFGEAENIGGGHYLLTLDYIMFGAWDQTITIRIGLGRIKLPIVLVAYP